MALWDRDINGGDELHVSRYAGLRFQYQAYFGRPFVPPGLSTWDRLGLGLRAMMELRDVERDGSVHRRHKRAVRRWIRALTFRDPPTPAFWAELERERLDPQAMAVRIIEAQGTDRVIPAQTAGPAGGHDQPLASQPPPGQPSSRTRRYSVSGATSENLVSQAEGGPEEAGGTRG